MSKQSIIQMSEAFARYPIPPFGGNTCNKCAGNVNFPTFFPAVPDLQAAVDDVNAKYMAAMNRDHEAIVARDLSHENALGPFRRERPLRKRIAKATSRSSLARAISRRSRRRRSVRSVRRIIRAFAAPGSKVSSSIAPPASRA